MSDLEDYKRVRLIVVAIDPEAPIVGVLCRKLTLGEIDDFTTWLKNEHAVVRQETAARILRPKTIRDKITEATTIAGTEEEQ